MISMGKPRTENSLNMLFLLIFVSITLASATANNVSSKPDNKVSTFFFGVTVKLERKKKRKKNE